MKVSKKSWHYRLNSMVAHYENTDVPQNLCRYFWFTLFSMFIVPLMTTGILGLCAFLAYIPIAPFVDVFRFHTIGTQLGLLGVVCDIGILLIFLGTMIQDKCSLPKLMVTYFKSIKKKYCPKLTFTEK